jgi:hypothetical protein
VLLALFFRAENGHVIGEECHMFSYVFLGLFHYYFRLKIDLKEEEIKLIKDRYLGTVRYVKITVE